MAVDTRQRRMSMLTFGSPDLIVDPNTSGVDNFERFVFLELYGASATATQLLIADALFDTEEEFYVHAIVNLLSLFSAAVHQSRLF